MKRRIRLLLLIFFSTLNLLSQECEYQEYYNIIDVARKQYSKKRYKEASKELKLAFSKVDFPLGHDLSFALTIAHKTKDDSWAGFIAEKLAKGGVPLRFFVKYERKKWYHTFLQEFPKHNEYYNKNFKPELKNKFNSLNNRDAIFSRKLMDWYYGTIEITVENASIEANAILSELKKLTEQYGFPSEHNMGYNYVKRLNRVERTNNIALLIHSYKHGERIYEEEIPNLICNGVLFPNCENILKNSRGFGIGTGIEQEMKTRYEMYKKKKK
ncbi:hypothetical protein [uncultured Aquimarina sp.]|uniref:hypothetical protein n=1 Tax=uncultured Aquimarina sp. TaxID=575652 RepID=UPI00262BC279|nr:hypothetical protein [uncultured Aquimarina sp.]